MWDGARCDGERDCDGFAALVDGVRHGLRFLQFHCNSNIWACLNINFDLARIHTVGPSVAIAVVVVCTKSAEITNTITGVFI